MFHSLTLRGRGGSVLWGYRVAAAIRTWTVRRAPKDEGGAWTLSATFERVYPFELRQHGLLFSAPRVGGFFVWPVLEPPHVDATRLVAKLGPPEQ